MMDREGTEVWQTRTYFAPRCPAQVMNRPQGIWSLDQFVFRSQIGAGHASIVYLVRDTVADTNLALKCYPGAARKPDVRIQVAHEIGIHARLQHPNILPLYGAFVENDDILLAMPYASQGSVFDLLRAAQQPFAEDFAVSCIIRPFLSGLDYLHSMNIMHRDIKTENVVVDEHSQVMIADFGLAIDTHTTSAHLRVGTPLYMAPEVFNVHSSTSGAHRTHDNGRTAIESQAPSCQRASAPTALHCQSSKHDHSSRNRAYGAKADCWSAAVFLYEVLTGSTPFAHIHDRHALERAVLFGPIVPPSYLSPVAQGFLTWALNRTPQVRPSVQQMLQHPWLHRACSSASMPALQTSISTSKTTAGASAPYALVHPAAPQAAAQCHFTTDAEGHGRGLRGCPSRRIVGFAPAVGSESSSSSSGCSSSLQLTGEAARGEVVQLSGMHRAIIDALRLRPPACSLSPRSQRSSQFLNKSSSTRSFNSCGGDNSQPMPPSRNASVPQRCKSSLLPPPPPLHCPPPRVSSLTQALSLQRDASCSDPPSPAQSRSRLNAQPCFSPLTCSSSQLAGGAAAPEYTSDSATRRSTGFPCANVTVIYACNEQASTPPQPSYSAGVHDDGSEGTVAAETFTSGTQAATAVAPACSAWLASAGLRPGPAAAMHSHAPDDVMNHVAASVFADMNAPRAGGTAGSVAVGDHPPGSACFSCGGPGQTRRCDDCQAAADLATIWQQTAGLSPIERQVTAPVRLQEEQLPVQPSDPPRSLTQPGPPAAGVVGGPEPAPKPSDRVEDSTPVKERHGERLPGVPISDGCGSTEEVRLYEVRGSWGGSIDSTSGPEHANLPKRMAASDLPDAFFACGAQVRVASWVANAAAVMWDASSEGHAPDEAGGGAFGDPFASPDRACRPCEVQPAELQAGVAHGCRDQSKAGEASGGADRGPPALQVWETKGALSSQGMDGSMLGGQTRSDTPPELQTWQTGGGKGGAETANSSGDVNSVVQTDQSAAKDDSSVGVGSRPLLQSYGVDGSTVSLHALAAALTPSMTGPSLLRESPVCPEGQAE